MSDNLEVTYTFNQRSLRRFVRGIRNWGKYETESDRAGRIGDLELAEMLIAAIRQWEGPGKYRIEGPCDAVSQIDSYDFIDFNEFMCTLSNWSRTMRLEKVSDPEYRYSGDPSGGYYD